MVKISLDGIEIKAFAAAVPKNLSDSYEDNIPSIIAPHDLLSSLITLLNRTSVNEQTASDLGYESAKKAIEKAGILPEVIGILIFGSSTPDYRSPATAAVLQHRLGIGSNCIGFDITGSGAVFTNLLGVAASSLKSSNAAYALIIFGDTPSRLARTEDNDFLSFGDGACAMILGKNPAAERIRIHTTVKTSAYTTIINPVGGFRLLSGSAENTVGGYYDRKQDFVRVNQKSLQNFTSSVLDESMPDFLKNSNEEVDYNLVVTNFGTSEELLKTRLPARHVILPHGFLNAASFGLAVCIASAYINNRNLRVLLLLAGEGLSFSISEFTINRNTILPIIETNSFFDNGSISHEM